MTADVQIRPYEVADEEGVVALWSAVFPNPAPRNEPRRAIASKLAVQRDLFVVAVLGGVIAGTAILDEKTEVLASASPSCIVERVAVDLADDQAKASLFDRVAGAHPRVVVVTEGLLVYLNETEVASLADGLRARPSMRRWILESIAPEVLKRNMRAYGKVLAQANAEWKFAHRDGFDFFRPHGWSPTATRPFIVEAHRLGRESEVPHAWVLRALSSLSGRFRRRMENLVVYGVMQPSAE